MSKQVSDMAKVFNTSVKKNYKLNEYCKNKCYVIYEINSEYHLRATLNAICRDEEMEYFSGKSVYIAMCGIKKCYGMCDFRTKLIMKAQEKAAS